jgi:hypothetical protein
MFHGHRCPETDLSTKSDVWAMGVICLSTVTDLQDLRKRGQLDDYLHKLMSAQKKWTKENQCSDILTSPLASFIEKQNQTKNCQFSLENIQHEHIQKFLHFLSDVLSADPETRFSCEEAEQHSFLKFPVYSKDDYEKIKGDGLILPGIEETFDGKVYVAKDLCWKWVTDCPEKGNGIYSIERYNKNDFITWWGGKFCNGDPLFPCHYAYCVGTGKCPQWFDSSVTAEWKWEDYRRHRMWGGFINSSLNSNGRNLKDNVVLLWENVIHSTFYESDGRKRELYRIAVVAKVDIEPNTELVYKYNYENHGRRCLFGRY